MSVDEALSISVVSPVGFWVFEPSGAGASAFAVTEFVSVGVCPCFDLCAISCHVEVVPVDEAKLCGVINGTCFQDGVDPLFQVCESQVVGVFLDVCGQFLDDSLVFWGVCVFVLGLALGVLSFGLGFADMVLGFHAGESGFKVEECSHAGDIVWFKAGKHRIVGDGAHHVHPVVYGVHLAGFHKCKGSHHVFWGDGWTSLGGIVVGGHHFSQWGEVQFLHHGIDQLMVEGNHLYLNQVVFYKLQILLVRT